MNTHKNIWIILVTIIITFFISSIFYLNNKNSNSEIYSEERTDAIEEVVNKSDKTIVVKHQYKDGKHIFAGIIEIPTPCHEFSANVVEENETTILDFQYSNSDQVCAEVITEKSFKLVFDGQKDDEIIARLNGEVVNLNVFEVEENKNIDEVDFYFKG